MKDLVEWVKNTENKFVLFYLYDQFFWLNLEEDGEHINIKALDKKISVVVKNTEELAVYVTNHVRLAPKNYDTILFDVKNAVCKSLRRAM